MNCMSKLVGVATVALSVSSLSAATLSGTVAPAYQQEALLLGSVASGGSFTTRIEYDGFNETRGVYEFALPVLASGGSYTSVNINYSVAETNTNGVSSSQLRFYNFSGNGRYDANDASAVGNSVLSQQFATTGKYSTELPVNNVNSISPFSPWLGVMAWQENVGLRTGVARDNFGGGAPSISYTANVPNAGTISTHAMVDVLSDNGTLTEGGQSINTQEITNVVNRRGVLEFNLGGLPSGTMITSATLRFNVNTRTSDGTNGGPEPRIYGYNGNGVASSSDATQTGNLIATGAEVTALGDYSIALNPTSIQSLLGSNNIVGLLVRGSADGNQFSFDTFDNNTSTPVMLEVSYAVPEPASIAVLSLASTAVLLRRRRAK